MRQQLLSLITEARNICLQTPRTIIANKNGTGDWVTKADLSVEKYLIREISRLFPNDYILAEETLSSFDPSTKENVWVIDPLDGTTNATFGSPIFGIAIAYVKKGEVTASAIYDNLNKEFYIAEKGKGAFTLSNQFLTIKEHGLKDGLVCAGVPHDFSRYLKQQSLMNAVHKAGSRIVTLGSSVIESVSVARNNLTLYFETGLSAWDVAATKLLVEEAGGVVQSFDGPFNIFNFSSYVCGSCTAVNEFIQLTSKRIHTL